MKNTNLIVEECKGLFTEIIDKSDSWVFIVSKKNEFLWANKKFLNIINKSSKQLINSKIESIPFIKNSHIDKKFKICLTGKKKVTEDMDISINKKRYNIKLKIFPFSSKELKSDSILVLIEDMTHFFDLSKNMKKTSRFMENLFNSVRVYSIITTDKNFLIQRFNMGAEILFEYSQEEVIKKLHIKKFFPKEAIKNFQEIIDVLKVINLVRREVEMENKSKERIVADLTVSKIIDEHKRHIGYIFMASDITEHKKLKVSIEKQNMELVGLYNETQRANKAKSFFLANMSHELRTPLTAILGFSELLMDEKIGALTDSQKEFLNDIYTSGKHLLTLINDILDLSKIEADRLELNIEKVCINDIINSAKMFIVPDTKKKNIQLTDKIPEKKIWVKADESRLKQTLYNIYSNAAKFTDENGRIITKVEADHVQVEIAITDTGIGIDAQEQDIIFEEFLQIESPYSKKHTGTGLGLALVKRFLEMMEGKIAVFSEGEGKGSTFTITLPLSE